MGVGDLMEGHKNGREESVHGYTHYKSGEQLQPRKGGEKILIENLCWRRYREYHSCFRQHIGGAACKNDERNLDAHPEKSPNDGTGQNPEARLVVPAFSDAQPDHLAQRGEHGKFDEADDKRVVVIEGLVELIHRIEDKKRHKKQYNTQYKYKILFLHNSAIFGSQN